MGQLTHVNFIYVNFFYLYLRKNSENNVKNDLLTLVKYATYKFDHPKQFGSLRHCVGSSSVSPSLLSSYGSVLALPL